MFYQCIKENDTNSRMLPTSSGFSHFLHTYNALQLNVSEQYMI
jgi:hypothetical protein